MGVAAFFVGCVADSCLQTDSFQSLAEPLSEEGEFLVQTQMEKAEDINFEQNTGNRAKGTWGYRRRCSNPKCEPGQPGQKKSKPYDPQSGKGERGYEYKR